MMRFLEWRWTPLIGALLVFAGILGALNVASTAREAAGEAKRATKGNRLAIVAACEGLNVKIIESQAAVQTDPRSKLFVGIIIRNATPAELKQLKTLPQSPLKAADCEFAANHPNRVIEHARKLQRQLEKKGG